MTKPKLTAAQVERISNALDSVPYAKLLGISLVQIDSGTATLKMPVRKQLTQNHGVVHGGAMASLIDSATAFAIISLLEPEEKVTTVDLTISYLRPVTEGTLNCAAKVVRSGRRLLVVSAEVLDDAQRLVATALSTYIKI